MKNNFSNRGQSLVGIIIVLVVVGLMSGGLYYYISKQIPGVSEITEKPVEKKVIKPEEKTVASPVGEKLPKEEVVPSAKEVPPEEVKPEITCQDGCSTTGLKKCSGNGYQICGNYDTDSCLEWSSIANCSSNTTCQNGICVQRKCTDGTLDMGCSITKPLYCQNLKLVNACMTCGCPEGMICQQNNSCAKIEPITSTLFNIPVLVLNYFPLDKADPTKIDSSIVGPYLPMGTTLEQMRQKTNRITGELVSGLEKGSSYHGYKDSDSQPTLKYTIFETKEFLRPIFRTNNPDWIFPDESDWGFTADHFNELNNINICDYVENKGVKEVWIWMYHYAPDLNGDGKADQDVNRYHVSPAESNMAGPYGDISNSRGINDLPICKKTYTVYEYNYTRDFGEAIEDHTHQMEAIFRYVDSDTFWNKFVGGAIEPFACGWTHCPPNVMSQCASHNYDWDNEISVRSNCEDWKEDGSGEIKTVNCHTWAGSVCSSDSGDKFKVWWMQNIPRDWWIYIGDFDQAMAEKRSLKY